MRSVLYLVLSFMGLLTPLFSYAQGGQTRNLPRYDAKPLHFGFILGSNSMDFRVRTNPSFPSTVFGVHSVAQPGFIVGIVSDVRVGNSLNVRFIPTYSAGERHLLFDAIDPSDGLRKELTKKIESSLVVFPLELKYKTERIHNHRWYVVGSLYTMIDLASKAKVVDDRLFKLQSSDYGYDVGVGIDLYFEYFKFSPQIRAQFGQEDLLVNDGTNYVKSLNGLNSRCLMIVFAFE